MLKSEAILYLKNQKQSQLTSYSWLEKLKKVLENIQRGISHYFLSEVFELF